MVDYHPFSRAAYLVLMKEVFRRGRLIKTTTVSKLGARYLVREPRI